MNENNIDNNQIQSKNNNDEKVLHVRHFSCNCLSCFVVCTVVLMIALGFFSFYVYKMPGMNNMIVCRENMEDIGKAITRYYDVNNKYPAKLDDLKKEYLKNDDVLICPAHRTREYIYHSPKETSPNDFPMLECKHKLNNKLPAISWVMYKDRSVKNVVEEAVADRKKK